MPGHRPPPPRTLPPQFPAVHLIGPARLWGGQQAGEPHDTSPGCSLRGLGEDREGRTVVWGEQTGSSSVRGKVPTSPCPAL